jgi:hypothetical protein
MLEVMATRAATIAAKRHARSAGAVAEWIEGDEQENLDIPVGEEGIGEKILELAGFQFKVISDLAVKKRFWQACR